MAESTATEKRSSQGLVPAKGDAYSPHVLQSTVELAASSTGDTIDFGNIPSNARVLGASKLYWDDLATTGSPTIDLGLAAVDSNLVNSDDPDALSNGHAVSSADADGAMVIGDVANIGTPAWDLVASESSDPGGELKVYGTIADASTTTTGTVTLELHYVVD